MRYRVMCTRVNGTTQFGLTQTDHNKAVQLQTKAATKGFSFCHIEEEEDLGDPFFVESEMINDNSRNARPWNDGLDELFAYCSAFHINWKSDNYCATCGERLREDV